MILLELKNLFEISINKFSALWAEPRRMPNVFIV